MAAATYSSGLTKVSAARINGPYMRDSLRQRLNGGFGQAVAHTQGSAQEMYPVNSTLDAVVDLLRRFDDLSDSMRSFVEHIVSQQVEHLSSPPNWRATTEQDTDLTECAELIDALEAAKLLGFDVSTKRKARAAKQHIYNLVRKNAIPSVRLTPRRIRFNRNQILRVIANGGNAKPYRRS